MPIQCEAGFMSSPRRKGILRFTLVDVVGLFLSAIAIGCFVAAIFAPETKALLVAGWVLVITGQVILWVRLARRMRLDDAQRQKR
jgi:membrane-bound ClpP family serine protease